MGCESPSPHYGCDAASSDLVEFLLFRGTECAAPHFPPFHHDEEERHYESTLPSGFRGGSADHPGGGPDGRGCARAAHGDPRVRGQGEDPPAQAAIACDGRRDAPGGRGTCPGAGDVGTL